MRLRHLLLPLLLLANTTAAAEDVADASGTTRVLRAGDSALRVQVVGPVAAHRREELQRWLADTARAPLAAFGRFPLREATVRIEQTSRASRSPVPWGQTLRRDDVAVLLYVREDASYDELRADWTAAHELSHLFHPYLGREGRWLAEGLASYYQNVLRARAGLMQEQDAWRELDAGFGRGRREASGVPLSQLGRGGTMRVYWAGAAFWLEADLALRRDHGSSLDAVLSKYARCCLRGTGEVTPAKFVADLDAQSGTELFTTLYRRYALSTAFPSLEAAYSALGLRAGDDGLHFSARRDAVRLRRDIMGRREVRAPQ